MGPSTPLLMLERALSSALGFGAWMRRPPGAVGTLAKAVKILNYFRPRGSTRPKK